MLGLSLGPGLGYVLLGTLHDAAIRAIIWYISMALVSLWGYRLYRQFDFKRMSHVDLARWYRKITFFYYLMFILWTVIFLLFIPLHASNLHYIAIFTQMGSAVVASSLLFSDRRLYLPIILILMIPLILYFAQISSWYGYVLTVFACVFAWVLTYAASSSNRLLFKTSYQASHDQLTGLYNRNYFIDAMQHTVNALNSNNGYCSLLLIDLDHFKTINDSLGHDVGDVMLKEVARRMGEIVPKNVLIARMGGDEFIVVGGIAASRQRCLADTMEMAEGLRESLKEVYLIGRHHLHISASIGISILHQPKNNANQYIKEADIAMYQVKDKGRDGIVLFGQEISDKVERNLQIERLLHQAIAKNEFYLNFQPQFDPGHNIVGCEVLLRWKNSKLGMVSPLEFIPIAEKTGLIIDIGYWVMQQSFKTLHEWLANGIDLQQLSINVSMRQFFFQTFPNEVDQLSRDYLTPETCCRITFELTESVMAEELDKLVRIMHQLKKQGFSFSIDDFGTGYSSLSYLRKVPLDEIKIDRSFIEEISTSKSDQSMIEMILNLSRVFGLKVVAEGVETQEQEDILLQGGCDLIQGYLLSRPLSREDFELLFRERQQAVPTSKIPDH
ncbi:MAG: bifunctional diguanylate cyclase/phosphodiesterase [Gammaproteobacteria bacterium]|nr:bifunctional diguanylate cyclase/phosphodiesterase [Gammaproteobacteria bacterium]MBL6998809.1 bifunctional diguanylate cyclase/phosphodiesterase [Gammaproteobacteria bacterium]